MGLLGGLSERGSLPWAQVHESVQLLRRAATLDASSPTLLNNLGFALFSANKPRDAMHAFGAAARLAPSDVGLHARLGEAAAAADEFASAELAFRSATRLAPTSQELRESLATAEAAARAHAARRTQRQVQPAGRSAEPSESEDQGVRHNREVDEL